MFHIFPIGLPFLLLVYLQEEIQGSPTTPNQNVLFSNISQNNIQLLQFMQNGQTSHVLTRVKRYESRIVGGTPAVPHEFPHQVYLSRPNLPCFCGGSIISKWLILTAAHCVQGRNASSITVTAGAHDRFRPLWFEQIRTVDEILVHPNYTRDKHDHDIAILVLSEPLVFSFALKSIGLPHRDAIFSGNTTVSGWGTTASGGSTSSVLRKVIVPIVPNSQCDTQYTNTKITHQMFCAGEEGRDSCQGDSGGPALCLTHNMKPVLCGIVSFGNGCGHAGYPGVYVQVSKYIGWILGVLNNRTRENDCLPDGHKQSNTADWTKCVTKYVLPETETKSCACSDDEPGFLLVTNHSSIMRIDLNQMDLVEPVPLRSSVEYAVDFDLKNNVLYWVESERNIKRRLHTNENGQPEVLASSDVDYITRLAFDWMSGNLYFTDFGVSKIEVIRTNGGLSGFHGQMRRILLKEPDVRRPWGIGVHPEKGYIFWTDTKYENSFIGRAHLDGSHAKKIVSNDNPSGLPTPILYDPRSIALDYIENRIYWVERSLDLIMTADLNGDDVKIVLQADSRIEYPYALGIYKNTVYWTGGSPEALYKAPLQLDKTVETNSISKIVGGNNSFYDLKVYGASSQQGQNLCTHSNCSYICMVSPGPQRSVSCLCPDGFTKQGTDTCI